MQLIKYDMIWYIYLNYLQGTTSKVIKWHEKLADELWHDSIDDFVEMKMMIKMMMMTIWWHDNDMMIVIKMMNDDDEMILW